MPQPIQRRFTSCRRSPYASEYWFTWHSVRVRSPDSSLVSRLPTRSGTGHWSQVAIDGYCAEVFPPAGVNGALSYATKSFQHQRLPRIARRGGPRQLAGSRAVRRRDQRRPGVRSASDYLDLIGAGRAATSPRGRYATFYDEQRTILAAQMGAPNSPQWTTLASMGEHHVTNAEGPLYVDEGSGKVHPRLPPMSGLQPTPTSSGREARLVSEGRITGPRVREARLFKYGSGHRHHFSACAPRAKSACPGGGKSQTWWLSPRGRRPWAIPVRSRPGRCRQRRGWYRRL